VPRFDAANRQANQGLVDLVKRIAGEKRITPAQVALAWLLARKPWIVPIPGTTKLHRLEENLGAAGVRLTTGEQEEIEAALAGISVHGNRYSVDDEAVLRDALLLTANWIAAGMRNPG